MRRLLPQILAPLLPLMLAPSCGSSVVAATESGASGPLLRPPFTADRSGPVAPAEESDALRQQKASVQQQLRLAQQLGDPRQEANPGGQAPATDREVELLKQLEVTLDRQQVAKERTEQLTTQEEHRTEELEQLRRHGLDEDPPYSFLLLDNVRDSVATQEARIAVLRRAIEGSVDALRRAKQEARAQSLEWQSASTRVDRNRDDTQRAALRNELREAEVAKQIAEAAVELRQTEQANHRLELANEKLRLEILEQRLGLVAAGAVFSRTDLLQRMLELDNQEDSLKRARQAKELEEEFLEQQWTEARRAVESPSAPSSAQRAEIESRAKERAAANEAKDLLNDRLAWVAATRDMWNRRYDVATGNFRMGDLDAWQDDAETFLDELASDRRFGEAQLGDIRSLATDVERQLQAAEANGSDALPALQRRQATLRQRADAIDAHIVQIAALESLAKKLVAEIDGRRLSLDFSRWAEWGWARTKSFWDYPLVTPAESLPIRISTVVKGLLLLVLGVWVSRRISNLLGSRLLPRFGVHEGAAHALKSLTFYALVLTSALMALRTVHVPLTLFTFLGGAAAIGIGLGSQRTLNDFLSGLIMLVEQPLRVGDLVELTQLIGTVEAIGMRSTRIRTPNNQETIVPNSTFLDNKVVNWTLSDSTVRCQVDVGVAYGSPTREVAKRLKQAAEKHGMVLRKPEPFVWFAGFGDNSLLFELHFFIVIRTLSERLRIESDLRFMIDQQFREAKISIAFPQRDVHLDTLSPLEIRMAPPSETTELEAPPPAIGSPASPATTPASAAGAGS